MSMQPVNAEKPPPGGLTVGGVTIPPRVAGGGIIAILVLIFILQNRDTSPGQLPLARTSTPHCGCG